MSEKTAFEKFKELAKTIINAPKPKQRKPKKKPAKKKGGINGLCVKYIIALNNDTGHHRQN